MQTEQHPPSHHGKKWLPEDDQLLLQNIHEEDRFIAPNLQRSAHAVACRRVHLAAQLASTLLPAGMNTTTLSDCVANMHADPALAEKLLTRKKTRKAPLPPPSCHYWIPGPVHSSLITFEVLEYMGHEIMQGLGAGYAESIYQHALFNKISKIDPSAKMEVSIPVVYEGEIVGACRADIVTSDFVIEIKALRSSVAQSSMTQIKHQIRKYLKHINESMHTTDTGGMRQGAVMNFNQEHERLEFYPFPQRIEVA